MKQNNAKKRMVLPFVSAVAVLMFCVGVRANDEAIIVGVNYPQTGPYSAQGIDQRRAIELAAEEINGAGGILGRAISLVFRDSQSKPDVSIENVRELIEEKAAQMILGGASSGVAVAVSDVCRELKTLYMATITSSNATTRERGNRYTFRVCYNAWMGAKALSLYLKDAYEGKRFFYVTADYTWGNSSEKSLRHFTNTTDEEYHISIKTPFPGARDEDFEKALTFAKIVKPDVLVLVLFGHDMSTAIRIATMMGLKEDMQIVVPILELSLAEKAGPKVMENVIGTADWNWQVPFKYEYSRGKKFVKTFLSRYGRYPCWGAITAYTNMYEYAHAVERAGTLNAPQVITALEGHSFTCLKDEQYWRTFDHQCVQSVFVVQCKTASEVMADPYQLDYFEILAQYDGDMVVQTHEEWVRKRREYGLPEKYETLLGEENTA